MARNDNRWTNKVRDISMAHTFFYYNKGMEKKILGTLFAQNDNRKKVKKAY